MVTVYKITEEDNQIHTHTVPPMVARKGKLKSVETLRKWVMQKAEFRTVAHETVRGFSNQYNDVGNRKGKTLKVRSYVTTGENKQNAEN